MKNSPRFLRLLPAVLGVILLASGCSAQPNAPKPTKPAGIDFEGLKSAEGDANGVQNLDGISMSAAVLAAVAQTDNVAFSGNFVEPGPTEDEIPYVPRTLEVEFVGAPEAYEATVTVNGVEAHLARSDEHVILVGDGVLAAQLGIPEVATGGYCLDATSALLERWRPLLSAYDLLESFLSPQTSEVQFATGSVSETPVPHVQLVVTDGTSTTGAVSVSTTGLPVPLDVTVSDASGTGAFEFSGWNGTKDVRFDSKQTALCMST